MRCQGRVAGVDLVGYNFRYNGPQEGGFFRRLERWMQRAGEGTTRVRRVLHGTYLAFSHSQSTGTRCHVAAGSGIVRNLRTYM